MKVIAAPDAMAMTARVQDNEITLVTGVVALQLFLHAEIEPSIFSAELVQRSRFEDGR
jgi:hypothetical protein